MLWVKNFSQEKIRYSEKLDRKNFKEFLQLIYELAILKRLFHVTKSQNLIPLSSHAIIP